jgi:hypothetical protein
MSQLGIVTIRAWVGDAPEADATADGDPKAPDEHPEMTDTTAIPASIAMRPLWPSMHDCALLCISAPLGSALMVQPDSGPVDDGSI